MDTRHGGLDGGSIWDDHDMGMFNTSNQFDDMTNDASFNDFISTEHSFADSPGLSLRASAKPDRNQLSSSTAQPYAPVQPVASAESSSQDSASDSSSRRKRKVTESPISDQATEIGVKKEDMYVDMGVGGDLKHVQQFPTRPMHDLSLEQDQNAMFDFGSAASSPIQQTDFNHAMSLDTQMRIPATSMAAQYQPSPTINPGMFTIGATRDSSPVMNPSLLNNASPQAIFPSNSSSDSPEAFSGQQWGPISQNPQWPQDFNNQFASPNAMSGLSPGSAVNGATPSGNSRTSGQVGRSPLHIASISTKSRVETQINVVMTLERPPPGVEHLHLPLHTIAKSKLLAKDDVDSNKSLELSCMLVCSSAMHNQRHREKAFRRAAAQNNLEIQRRAEEIREKVARASTEEEKNQIIDPMKNMTEDSKPSNGGEVRICANCIQRERKRAGRKKLKREEEQQHWERFETERVVVFNSNEYLPFKPPESNQRDGPSGGSYPDAESYTPPEGALQVTAAMRIACYCRHQSEKEGFRVIFTMKDQAGNVVAQQMSDSILITDDHKTHPPTYTTMQTDGFVGPFATPYANGLPMSHSMLELQHASAQQGVHPFTSSRSTGNLQALAYGSQYNAHSHVHQIPQSGHTSQTTSATMTPTALSRPASPTGAGQAGPNKKRKSSTFHRRVPSGLTMTPVETRVDQGIASGLPSATSTMTSPFSPPGDGMGLGQQSYMTIPANNGPANYYASGPPTPSENQQSFQITQAQIDHITRERNAQAYFSHPSSAVPSRSGSPVLQQQSRPNMTAYARQPQAIQTPTNSIPGRGPMSQQQQQHAHSMYQQQQRQQHQTTPAPETDNSTASIITKITPTEGPSVGGTEVSIFGYNFQPDSRVVFGDREATTTYYGPTALLATSPPSRPGGVNVTLMPPLGQQGLQYASPPANRQIFTYTDKDPRMMELALRYLSQQQSGNSMGWNQMANQLANQYVSNNIGRAGIGGQHQGNMMAGDSSMDDELCLASAGGMADVVKLLLQQHGANPDAQDSSGYTPLMHAAIQGQLNIIRLLLSHGADPSLRCLAGYSARELTPGGLRGEFERLVMSVPRASTSRRPSLQPRSSYGNANTQSWNPGSTSLYESEQSESAPPSRRLSAVPSLPPMPEENIHMFAQLSTQPVPAQDRIIQEALAARIQPRGPSSLQQPSGSAPSYAPDNIAAARRAPLHSHRAMNDTPPPAYHELYPNTTARALGGMMAFANEAADSKITSGTSQGQQHLFAAAPQFGFASS
ncbi:Protein MGA2 [Teratosphaeria destructans]|uniref:Protein MGA2 n=1 Tax=Teratosphaeria destructans TaxID=418781 RepID=A0A9W7SZA2_9PEZI|nr:Protein MGA2 [Teratosphaeria destructans]